MNVIQNKLKSQNGASIFMGLMFLLVCVMVGTVVLVASTAAAGKLAEQQKREQAYLNVSSAAQLIKDRICKTKYKHKTDGSDPPTGPLSVSDGKVILKPELTALCNTLAENTDPNTLQSDLDAKKAEFVINRKPGSASPAEEWETVYGSLRMGADGRIFVELWLGKKDENKDYNHMKIEFCPDGPVKEKKVITTDAGVTETVITTCSWPEDGCTITKG